MDRHQSTKLFYVGSSPAGGTNVKIRVNVRQTTQAASPATAKRELRKTSLEMIPRKILVNMAHILTLARPMVTTKAPQKNMMRPTSATLGLEASAHRSRPTTAMMRGRMAMGIP